MIAVDALSRTISIVLASALSFAPTHVVAAAPAAEPAVPADALAEAKAWHLEADAKYNTADYDGAITAWEKAFAALPRTQDANTYRSLIYYNIAAAREKLFALRGDVEHLKQAKILLQQFEASIDETYSGAPEQGEEERARVQEKLVRIEGLIAEATAEDPPATPPEPGPPVDPEPVRTPPTDVTQPGGDSGRSLLIAGGVLAGLGVLAGAGMTAALLIGRKANDIDGIEEQELAKRKAIFDRGRRANAGAIAGGVLGTVLVAAGVALLVVGAKRKARATAMAPLVGRSVAGVVFIGRF